MHIIISVDAELKARIDAILGANTGYRDIDEFIRRAISNQLALESSASQQPQLPRDIARTRAQTPPPPKGTTKSSSPLEEKVSDSKFPAPALIGRSIDENLIRAPSTSPSTVGIRGLPDVEMKKPLWGQINRYGPCKLPLRVLSNLLIQLNASWIDIKQVSANVSEQAPIVREMLEARDQADGRRRGEELSAAFPRMEKSSIQRFSNQYLGYYAAESNQPKGILADLSFIDIRKTPEGIVEIGLTKPGLEFSTIGSPLLDEVVIKKCPSTVPLSSDEVNFLVGHLKIYRSGEYNFLLHVLRCVEGGSNTPTALLTSVEEFFKNSAIWPDATSAVVGTMRAGAVSKLVELGFLGIERDGSRSKYVLTGDPGRLMGADK